jgi:DNA-binding IclR family transcriptional regulator
MAKISPTGGAAREPTRVPAVERAFSILRLLASSGPSPLSELVESSGLNKSTVFYIVRTLTALDIVDYDERSRTYALGPGLMDLGLAATEQFSDVVVAKRELGRLLEGMNATIVLYRRVSADAIMMVDKIERPHRVRITLQAGVHVPIQGGSFGRAFLAFDPAERVNEVLRDGLHRFTPKSLASVREFRRQLVEVRERGWAVDHEGFALGVSTVAAPIFGADGEICLVAAAVGFTNLVTDAVSREWGTQLRRACDRIGQRLRGKDLAVPVSPGLGWQRELTG